MILKHAHRRKISVGIVILIGAVIAATAIVVANNADAAINMDKFSNQLTNPKDVTAGGSEGAVDLHLKNVSNIANVPRNVMAAYFPDNITTAKGLKLQIQNGSKGRVCNINTKVANGSVRITIQTSGGTTVKNIPIKDVCSTNKFFGSTVSFPGGALKQDSTVGLGRADITVEFTGDPKSSTDLGGSDAYSLNYNLKLSGSNSNKVHLAMVKSNDTGDGSSSLGLRSSYKGREDKAKNRQVQASVVFGFKCDTTPSATTVEDRAIRLYDADAVFGETYLWVEKDGNKLIEDDYAVGQSKLIGTWQGGSRKAWLVEDSNDKENKLVIKSSVVDINSTYKVFVLNTGKKSNGSDSTVNPHGNTLSLSIPQDSIYGAGKCNYQLTPNVNPPKNSSSSYVEGATIPVTGHIGVEGYDIHSHAWQLTKRVYSNKPGNRSSAINNQLPCEWKSGRAGSCEILRNQDDRNFKGNDFQRPHDFDSTGVNAGDWVCFVMSVNQHKYNVSETRWSHSAMKCVGIEGDVSGTTVDPLTYSYYPSLTATSIIDNLGGYPKVDDFKGQEYKRDYPWRILEAKFTSMPSSSIGEAEGGGCDEIETKYAGTYIAGSCNAVATGDDIFPNNNPTHKRTATSSKSTPDPIGTWTCYTLRYRNNPEPSASLNSDINTYVSDWNDNNSSSGTPSRWGDGYYRYWVPPVKDEDGNVIESGYYDYSGTPENASDIWNGYVDASPGSSPAKYTYTDYGRTSCSVSGIYPKVQIQSHDLRASGSIKTSLTSIVPGPYSGIYGSWGEYGVMSSGINSGMASGAGLNRGNPSGSQADWSTLTFANNKSPEFGNFNGGLYRSFNYSQAEQIDGDLTINSSNVSDFTTGKKIYVVSGRLTIDTNLAYGNNYQVISQIPRIILVAQDITITPSVTRIDPWLVTDGALNTCSSVSYEDEGFSDAKLSTGKCSNKLTFNGAVMAGQVYLFRTAGSRDSHPSPEADGRRTLREPAEVFNLRPDAFLSSFSNEATPRPVVNTDRIIDLPPRF